MRRQIVKHASCGAGVVFACLALLMATASLVSGQETPAAAASDASDSAQPVQRDYRFEVASIRPGDPTGRLSGRPGPSYTPGRFRSESETIDSLAFVAFRVKHGFQIECPHWMATTYFTINATLPEGATKADLPIMIKHLLEDRFALKYHHETRQMAGYELVVVKSSPQLAKSATPDSNGSAMKAGEIEMNNGVMQFKKDAGSGQLYNREGAIWRGRNRTMKTLAADLAASLQAPVMDATGLEGGYDYTLTFTPEATTDLSHVVSPLPMGGTPGPAGGADEPSAPLAHPLLRDALQEQLGLKLQSVKNVPVDVVIIDSANKVPTEN